MPIMTGDIFQTFIDGKAIGPEILTYYPPTTDLIALVSIPHGGEMIPTEFEKHLSGNENAYWKDIDYKTPELVDIKALQSKGIGVLVAHIHRICVDLNRSPVQTILAWKSNSHGELLVKADVTQEENNYYLTKYYTPYYELLKSLIHGLEKSKTNKSELVSFIDLHSMPSKPTAYHLSKNPSQKMTRPEFCISDLHETSCTKNFLDQIVNALAKNNRDVQVNIPYFGGHLTQFAASFKTNALQIEINRSAYMDESTGELIKHKAGKIKEEITKSLINVFLNQQINQ